MVTTATRRSLAPSLCGPQTHDLSTNKGNSCGTMCDLAG